MEADDAGWMMDMIIASGLSNEGPSKRVYLIKWEGHSHEQNTWETYDNVMDHAEELLEEHYGRNEYME